MTALALPTAWADLCFVEYNPTGDGQGIWEENNKCVAIFNGNEHGADIIPALMDIQLGWPVVSGVVDGARQ